MEGIGKSLIIPSIKQICDVNRRIIEYSGGDFIPPNNLRDINSLEYILGAISYTVYGYDLFPSLKDKASALAFQIVYSHVFVDGSKRTGLFIAWEFLHENGIDIYFDDFSVFDLIVSIAKGKATREELLHWLHHHQSE